MRRRSINFFAFLLTLLLLAGGSASAASLVADTSENVNTQVKSGGGTSRRQKDLQIRSLSSKALDAYRRQPEFTYDDVPLVEGQSWWSRFWNRFWQWLRDIFGDPDNEERPETTGFNFLVIAAIVGVILYLVIKYMHLENIFRKKPETTEVVPYSESLKNIHEISFDKQIAEAVEKRNYKIAVRLHYLSVLKRLSDGGLIVWQPDKPNSVYLQEIKDSKYREPFLQLTRQFEYVWYGDFPLGAQAFGNIDRLFSDFKRILP